MTAKTTTVAVLCGGQSVEHEISLISAASVAAALTEAGYAVLCLYIDKQGGWWLSDRIQKDAKKLGRLALVPGEAGGFALGGGDGDGKRKDGAADSPDIESLPACVINAVRADSNPGDGRIILRPDVVFPVLHGIRGEDGMVQGMLTGCSLPFVGAGIIGSAVTNDKDITKRLLREGGLPVVPHIAISSPSELDYDTAVKQLGSPLWVKPAGLGSSLGIRCAETADEYASSLKQAFALDTKVLVEQHTNGRELECAVLQTAEEITVSLAGEIIVRNKHRFYDYDAKYHSDDKTTSAGEPLVSLQTPAELPPHLNAEITRIARSAFQLLEGRHIMRLDLFLTDDEKLLINEVQTIPGFTSISMYPKLLALKGIPLPQLADKLVRDALGNSSAANPDPAPASDPDPE